MGAPSDQVLRIEYGGPLRSVSSLIMEASLCGVFSYYMGTPQIISMHTILALPDHFPRLLYGAPQITFFSYNMGAPLRSVSLFTIWAPPLRSVSLHAIRGPPQILVSSQNIWGPPQISFSAYYMGPPQVSFFADYMGPLRSVSVHTFWWPLSDNFFSYYMGPPQISFFAYYIGGGGGPQISFFAYYMRAPLKSVSSLTKWGPH